MKKSVLVLSVLLLIIPLIHAAGYSSAGDVAVTLVSQSPDPVEPGQVMKIKFKIENQGAETAEKAVVRIMPKYPFSLYGDVAEKNIGKLRAGSTGADAVIVEYTLKVDQDAVEQETEIELVVELDGTAVEFTDNEFMVDIETDDAVLDVVSIETNPSFVAPGETSSVTVKVRNVADSLLKDIRFRLDFSNVPLAPYQSSSERRIALLDSDFQKMMEFGIIAEPDAVAGLYKIPLNITYNDERGNNFMIEDVLSITIGSEPVIKPYIRRSSVLQSGKEGKLTIAIANAGLTGVKFLQLTLLPSDDYQLLSTSNYFYIGDTDSDDTESEEIDIYVDKDADGLHIPVLLEYFDANNRRFEQEFDLEMQLYSASELKKFGVIERNYGWLYVLLVIMVIAGIIFYRRYRKKNK